MKQYGPLRHPNVTAPLPEDWQSRPDGDTLARAAPDAALSILQDAAGRAIRYMAEMPGFTPLGVRDAILAVDWWNLEARGAAPDREAAPLTRENVARALYEVWNGDLPCEDWEPWRGQADRFLAALGVARPDPAPPEREMCPNCVTPWKCNGPHVPVADPAPPLDPEAVPPPDLVAAASRLLAVLRPGRLFAVLEREASAQGGPLLTEYLAFVANLAILKDAEARAALGASATPEGEPPPWDDTLGDPVGPEGTPEEGATE